MSKILKIHYSSSRNHTFSGVDTRDVTEDYEGWELYTEEEREKALREEEEMWLWDNVEVYAEVVDG